MKSLKLLVGVHPHTYLHPNFYVKAMRLGSILFFVFLSVAVLAKTIEWDNAVVVLNNNEVLVGEVVIQPGLDLILFKAGETRTFYAADKINYININDGDVNIPRKFVSLRSDKHGRPTINLYEVVIQGELSVLRKPRGSSLPDFNDAHGYEYFVKESSGLVKLSDFRKSIYPIIEQYYSEGQLMKFMNQENLSPWSPSDAIKLIEIYNDRLPIDSIHLSARK